MTKTERKALERIASKLDQTLADSDISHLENDDDILAAAPGQWACSQINKLLQSARTEKRQKMLTEERILELAKTVRNPRRSTVEDLLRRALKEQAR